ncbi:uncharacterized protein KNAG_0G00966 [Huiozyma naganishii CBS 8797]|uniref:Retrovirus-related Pol polyprotein from transposon TNT 1-94-like beta-barrel domain-containing protein n=1 Tax=Huiozyma naganishii (strain ATCC MYA-139 / BCRC 22969 / CBS 8797 / KCTC 17520 / NBRC 10181 / NCYC 3082 / Yp74L-3) TaxID=1071383 RepID=J7S7S6_HUIN7|nr:hypothetical protein KNAG_0G00966 [Kazachstania naganishii CBS 8797]CCK71154.1 hypothetical protein KNAG_0G00966 [Kazachstania naganishii CBS 8797]
MLDKGVSDEPQSSALVVQKHVASEQNNKRVCSYCGNRHSFFTCRKFKKEYPEVEFKFGNFQKLYGARKGQDQVSDYSAFIAYIGKKGDDLNSSDTWFIDSGCSNHIANSRSFFNSLSKSHKGKVQEFGNSIVIKGRGNGVACKHRVDNVDFVPESPANLLSVSQMTRRSGKNVLFTPEGAYLTSSSPHQLDDVDIIGKLHNGLYRFIPEEKVALWAMD